MKDRADGTAANDDRPKNGGVSRVSVADATESDEPKPLSPRIPVVVLPMVGSPTIVETTATVTTPEASCVAAGSASDTLGSHGGGGKSVAAAVTFPEETAGAHAFEAACEAARREFLAWGSLVADLTGHLECERSKSAQLDGRIRSLTKDRATSDRRRREISAELRAAWADNGELHLRIEELEGFFGSLARPAGTHSAVDGSGDSHRAFYHQPPHAVQSGKARTRRVVKKTRRPESAPGFAPSVLPSAGDPSDGAAVGAPPPRSEEQDGGQGEVTRSEKVAS